MEVSTKIRIRFTKKGPVRFLSHHDMMRFFERSIRRAALPVKMSQGYNPRPRFSVAAALGVGVAADQEILDIELDEQLHPSAVRKRLSQTLIPGVEIVAAEQVAGKRPRVCSATYRVQLPEDISIPQDAIEQLLKQEEVIVERTNKKKSKRIDIRPVIQNIHGSGSHFELKLKITNSGSARPEEVIAALIGKDHLDRNRLQIERTKLETEPED